MDERGGADKFFDGHFYLAFAEGHETVLNAVILVLHNALADVVSRNSDPVLSSRSCLMSALLILWVSGKLTKVDRISLQSI